MASFGYTTTPVLSVSGTYEPPIIEAYIVIGQGLTPATKFLKTCIFFLQKVP